MIFFCIMLKYAFFVAILEFAPATRRILLLVFLRQEKTPHFNCLIIIALSHYKSSCRSKKYYSINFPQFCMFCLVKRWLEGQGGIAESTFYQGASFEGYLSVLKVKCCASFSHSPSKQIRNYCLRNNLESGLEKICDIKDINRWKAMDLSFDLAPSYHNFEDTLKQKIHG